MYSPSRHFRGDRLAHSKGCLWQMKCLYWKRGLCSCRWKKALCMCIASLLNVSLMSGICQVFLVLSHQAVSCALCPVVSTVLTTSQFTKPPTIGTISVTAIPQGSRNYRGLYCATVGSTGNSMSDLNYGVILSPHQSYSYPRFELILSRLVYPNETELHRHFRFYLYIIVDLCV